MFSDLSFFIQPKLFQRTPILPRPWRSYARRSSETSAGTIVHPSSAANRHEPLKGLSGRVSSLGILSKCTSVSYWRIRPQVVAATLQISPWSEYPVEIDPKSDAESIIHKILFPRILSLKVYAAIGTAIAYTMESCVFRVSTYP